MSTPVNGPGDVAVGDLVEVRIHYKRSGREGVATVKKATADKLTVAWPDGKSSSLVYSFGYLTEGLYPRSLTHHNFGRLDAHDRWRHIRPATPDIGKRQFRDDYEVDATTLRDRPDDVIAQVRALSAWLKDEPSKDAP